MNVDFGANKTPVQEVKERALIKEGAKDGYRNCVGKVEATEYYITNIEVLKGSARNKCRNF